MAFCDFDLRNALSEFSLRSNQDTDLFADIATVEPSDSLQAWLEEFAPVALGFPSNLARSVYLIAPILADAQRQARNPFTAIPGIALNVDEARGLSGDCDFLLTHSAKRFSLYGPLVGVVNASREHLTPGFGPCVAEMVAIRIFNEREKTPLATVFGCVTSGNLWRFLKLEGDTLFIDKIEYYLRDLPKLLGILVHIADTPRPTV